MRLSTTGDPFPIAAPLPPGATWAAIETAQPTTSPKAIAVRVELHRRTTVHLITLKPPLRSAWWQTWSARSRGLSQNIEEYWSPPPKAPVNARLNSKSPLEGRREGASSHCGPTKLPASIYGNNEITCGNPTQPFGMSPRVDSNTPSRRRH